MSYLVLDLETIPDERLKLPEPRTCSGGVSVRVVSSAPPFDKVTHSREHPFLSSANVCLTCGAPPEPFLPPPYHRIVSLGYALLTNDYELKTLEVLNAFKDEADALKTLVEYLETHPRTTLVTFNGRTFDAPVLAARCLVHGIPFPWHYRSKARLRYDASSHLDLMDYLADFGAAPKARMDVWAQAMGMPGKAGTDGSQVAGLVAEGKLGDVYNYNACDVIQETALFLRLQFLRSVITNEVYQWAMVGVLREVLDRSELAALRNIGIDWHRALLSREEL